MRTSAAESPADAATETADSSARIVLRRGRARPLWFGHPWVYADAVDRIEGSAVPGSVVSLADHDGRFIARGIWNPRSQIRVRVLTRKDEPVGSEFLQRRIRQARALRTRLGLPSERTTTYRLVNSEGDDLPGLVIDVFGDVVAVQITTLGLWQRREAIFDALEAELRPRAVCEIPASGYAEVEGFAATASVVRGAVEGSVPCVEDGIRLAVDPFCGQKTGMFIDQRESRIRIGPLCGGARVLDCYAFAGGFALQAARSGARSVVAVDSSERAVERVKAHATLNAATVDAIAADAFRYLDTVTPGSFDLVVIDPPKFARSRQDFEAARKGYEKLNALALTACAPGAVLVTASCSQQVGADDFERIVGAGAKQAGRSLRIFERRGAAPDHTALPAFPEGQYLKVIFAYVL